MVEAMTKRFLMSALLLFSLILNLQGQQPRPQPSPLPKQPSAAPQKSPNSENQDIVRITTQLVQVDVVVLTKDGKPVTDLKAEDFEISEDGRAQTITNFSYVSNVPASTGPRPAPAPVSGDLNGPPVVSARVSEKEVRRTIAIVVDDLGTSFESMARMKKQLLKFVDEQVQPKDLVAIIRTGGEVGALQQFTTDRRLLHSALENLRWNHCSRAGIQILPAARSMDLGSSNPCILDAFSNTVTALRFILRGMRDLPGRKSMIILSDSMPTEQQDRFDQNSLLKQNSRSGQRLPIQNVVGNSTNYSDQLQSVAELAVRASVVIYGVDTTGVQTIGLNAADEIHFPLAGKQGLPDRDPLLLLVQNRSAILRQNREGADLLARETGGFLIRNTNDFELQRVLDDQQGYYLIGYRPSDETFNRSFHHIKARVKRGGFTVRTRAGFYGVTEEQARPVALIAGDQMNLALISPFGTGDIPVRLTTFFVNDRTAGSLLRSFLFLDARDLTFKEQDDGTHEASFALSSIVFGNNGAVVDRIDKTATLRLRGAPYDRVMREGVVYAFDTPVKESGTFQFRVAVRDATSSRIGTAGQFAEIPNLTNDRLALSGIVVRDDEQSRTEGPANYAVTGADDGITAGPAVRRFHQGATLTFAFGVYNARLNKTTGLPEVRVRMRIFREGKPVFTGNPAALEVAGQLDLKRLNGAARFQLGPELPPGQYVLQIIVDDNLAKEKQRTATQWIDFEVVK